MLLQGQSLATTELMILLLNEKTALIAVFLRWVFKTISFARLLRNRMLVECAPLCHSLGNS